MTHGTLIFDRVIMNKYRNRQEAGKVLAHELRAYANRDDVIILALPRGGVPVAYEVAKVLHVPLDVFIVRKIGVPGHAELAMGAIAMGHVHVFNQEVINDLDISQTAVDAVIAEEEVELKRREKIYRDDKPFPVLKDKTVILIDDGIATGASMRAAISALKQFHPAKLIVAVPVAEQNMYEDMQTLVDKLICPLTPAYFHAVGLWYEDFSQTEDDEVRTLLRKAEKWSASD